MSSGGQPGHGIRWDAMVSSSCSARCFLCTCISTSLLTFLLMQVSQHLESKLWRSYAIIILSENQSHPHVTSDFDDILARVHSAAPKPARASVAINLKRSRAPSACKEASGANHTGAAIMVVGLWGNFLDPISSSKKLWLKEFNETGRAALLRKGISTISKSQQVHVLEPLKSFGFIPEYFVCTEQLDGELPSWVTAAFAFDAQNQLMRLKGCLQLVLQREAKCNLRYSLFIKIRPDFLTLTDIPNPLRALSVGCFLSRVRSANHIEGLTNEHLSYCYCSKDCCKGNLPQASHKDNTRDFMVDDMAFIAGRDVFLRIWQGQGVPREPLPSWPKMPPSFPEAQFTTVLLQKGVPVCPLALRGLPLSSVYGAYHMEQSRGCGYIEGGGSIKQECGSSLNGTHILQPY